ncbi:NAD(P)/FAD-dependent oxidoreductase [Hymenobacter gummosus]|uniref:NAD(P)/FAD-dependent oxidoreductase n=1 Tax=Hymenobacter gummosus TaxID=1776032 RepID=A0A431TXS2_9BACT|nr:NAD(P)/FAD-dependent oxidoreductase [Hymenobacter gummosus]RTQ46891.1 NAD(P)/FAD-dependent oxidoreductase [Hymenobacter gummosus]
MPAEDSLDVLIIGGSYAGLAAALSLGRARRRVLVLDAGRPCNRQTPHSHNFLTRDGAAPAELAARARAEVQAYPSVRLQAATAVRAEATQGGFRVTTAEGPSYAARRLVLATGVVDELPPVPGLAECWGISVLHCPYCHGYEVRDAPLAVLGNGDLGFEFARLIRHWSPDLRLLTNGPATLTPAQAAQLAAHGIGIVDTPLQALEHQAGQFRQLRLADGAALPLTALFARVPNRQSSDLPAQLGCALTETGLLQVDELQRTSVPGVYAAGDTTTPLRQVAAAVAAGSRTGAFINHELIAADF